MHTLTYHTHPHMHKPHPPMHTQFPDKANITEFTMEPKSTDPDETMFALYIDQGSTKFYLMPHPLPVYGDQGREVGHRKTILAEEEHDGQDKYVFSFADTTYGKPQEEVGLQAQETKQDDGVGGNQQAMPEGNEPQEDGVQRRSHKNCIIM